LGGCCSAKLPGFLETYSREKRATHDFSAGIESPAEETQALASGHFDVLRILKTSKYGLTGEVGTS
jgi:hypothetical protein